MEKQTKKLEMAKKAFGELLEAGEEILAHAGWLVLTNRRILQASMSTNGRLHTSASFWLEDIDRLEMRPKKPGGKGPVSVSTKNGEDFSLLEVSESDWLDFEKSFLAIRPSILSSGTPNDGRSSGMGQGEDLGEIAVETVFGTKKITIYRKGFVKVSGQMGIAKADAQKLMHIEGESQTWKKTAGGRGVTAIGLSLIGAGPINLLSPNRRGDLSLTIATDREVFSILKEMPSNSDIKAMHQLIAAGKAVIAARGAQASPVASMQTAAPSLATQIAELNDLRTSGVITETEFEAAKAKLLS